MVLESGLYMVYLQHAVRGILVGKKIHRFAACCCAVLQPEKILSRNIIHADKRKLF